MAALPSLPPLPINPSDLCESHGFSNTAHWVVPNVLMQGARPTSDTTPTIVAKTNCSTFVSLQAECVPVEGGLALDDGGARKEVPIDLPSYSQDVLSFVTSESSSGGPSPAFLYYGIIGDQTAKSLDSLSNVVTTLADRVHSGESLYIHCGGGAGRAGLVTACLLGVLYDELDAEIALEYTNDLCQLRNVVSGEDKHYNSPEKEVQREQVREFFKRIRAEKKK
ncbi:predicted protein [Thalassiosira pseudonana CCMP1335]|uniref:Tyrosine specific protein phosphatases domain-containing protein n=1 Tax=Thalassiosira pseudonana TaxID=35128 RepID=B8LDA9_THAPS|nr:predicted protein [Thalassiosira pseudonana CCMP1335]EED86680.1 predicted protein [Thalassiosira pseudonana CCMP1335]|eukprot:scaffold4733_cov170-Alexandrium_tamarense.AAC.43